MAVNAQLLEELWNQRPLLSTEEIANRLGVKVWTIYRWARKLGLGYRTPMRRAQIDPEVVARWIQVNKTTQRAAAKRFGCSEAHVCHLMARRRRQRASNSEVS